MIHFFQPPFVFYTPVHHHTQIKQHILSNLNRQDAMQSDVGNAMTTNGRTNHHLFTPDILTDMIWNPFDQMIQECQFDFILTHSKLSSIWWNHYLPGNYSEPHKHIDSDFSGIYLLHLEEPNTTVFYQNGDSSSIPLYERYYTTHHIEEGNVLIFPSRLLHYTTPSSKQRYVVVFNIDTQIQ